MKSVGIESISIFHIEAVAVDQYIGPSVNKESLSEIPFYSMFRKLPVTRKLVLCIVHGCNHNSSRESCKFYRFPANKRTNWGELSR